MFPPHCHFLQSTSSLFPNDCPWPYQIHFAVSHSPASAHPLLYTFHNRPGIPNRSIIPLRQFQFCGIFRTDPHPGFCFVWQCSGHQTSAANKFATILGLSNLAYSHKIWFVRPQNHCETTGVEIFLLNKSLKANPLPGKTRVEDWKNLLWKGEWFLLPSLW